MGRVFLISKAVESRSTVPCVAESRSKRRKDWKNYNS
jgi:hypothetical protein